MLTYKDCLGLAGLTEEEISAVAAQIATRVSQCAQIGTSRCALKSPRTVNSASGKAARPA